ncbi:arginine--tRNA ligase [Candidatus Kaiserbacteria bacterium RIFCSPHIGHO2_02_FULL_55_25]|uniref:Arginine--tRNA ligase n=1 Tax=Candidatus Kaiserbacteria bacterium RIFCSPHIGHO2_02_FULL_55_25 TaxID=1798498 RepID=A0A1F6E538_9BACT|nr:MAG: arginine--tRNA ligase [Candidatus Kaiserbacteria bacterium RIFCSPHIGHO2_01_FULL_55_79]OGG68803.1 MAG: arginine--tRNA ligase [Candidatus Kaiserbacteria bacterium RIFCSPHIGHO2_02_FULL_55_25]OGG77278.1 MAG: arginine--tRNA ligase [Candidatus Kaiserbacteria bacterium RIFCSPHIGHO2_12_FULL_55_13]OGG82973.1 MAG: arginine--tRNA ligase [Candidatus Kaiserbacteria bacterium RIFCSPLOWO2_01_FULL_55_25]
MREMLKKVVSEALNTIGISTPSVVIEHPAELSHGDYATGAALQYAKQAGIAPRALAEKIVAALGIVEGVSKVDIAGPGFINFHLAPATLAASIEEARKEDMLVLQSLGDGGWGANKNLAGKKIMVEYTDPNPFKEFHIGHLMSNAIGESISRLVQFSGAEVKRANYQGDVGPHVAKCIWGMEQDMEQVASILHTSSVSERPAALLGAWYARGTHAYDTDEKVKKVIDEINAIVYKIIEGQPSGDKREVLISNMYKAGRELSLAHFEELYEILGTKFDYYFFESATAPKGLEIVRAHPEVFEQSDGAVVYKGEKVGLHTRVFITSKGLPTYETKELGLAELKAETWECDTSITITAHEQAGYFAVVVAAMKEVMPDIAKKITHVSHGMMRFAEGKMSSRTGNVITGESLLTDLTEAAQERAKESRADNAETLAQNVAVAAIKYQILKQGSGKDIIFDRERALSLEGDSGPYLQYAHARTQQVLEKAKEQNVAAKTDSGAEPNEVAHLLHRFPEVVENATTLMEPHVLTNYLIVLAAAFNSWYGREQILDGSTSSPHKVALTDAVRRTLKNGLWILGIPAPEKM